jgi:hypothetical protein
MFDKALVFYEMKLSVSNFRNFVNGECLLDYLHLTNTTPRYSIQQDSNRQQFADNWNKKKYRFTSLCQDFVELCIRKNIRFAESPQSAYHYIKHKYPVLIDLNVASPLLYGKCHIVATGHALRDLIGLECNSEEQDNYCLIQFEHDYPITRLELVILTDCLKHMTGQDTVSAFFCKDDKTLLCPDLSEARENFNKGTNWLTDVRSGVRVWTLDDCPHPLMWPNLSPRFASQTGYEEIKLKLAHQWKDIECIYYIGSKAKRDLHSEGIYKWDDARFLDALEKRASKQLPYQKLIVQNLVLEPELAELQIVEEDCFETELLFIDTESAKEGEKWVVKMVGECDKSGCYKWSTLEEFRQGINSKAVYVHYTAADDEAFDREVAKIDLHKVVLEKYLEDVRLQKLRLTNFSLKTLTKCFCERFGLDNFYYKLAIQNGLDAACFIAQKGVTDDVARYNKVDCAVMTVLYHWILFDSVPKRVLNELLQL